MFRRGLRLLLFPLALLNAQDAGASSMENGGIGRPGVVLREVQPASAQGQQSGWEKAAALPAGTKVELLLVKDKTLTGTLDQVSPEGLTLTRKKDSLQVARSDIRRLWVTGKGSRLKNAGIAALIGFGVACPIGWASAGYIADTNHPSLSTKACFCAGMGGFFGGIAAGVTAAVPATRRTLIYRAP